MRSTSELGAVHRLLLKGTAATLLGCLGAVGAWLVFWPEDAQTPAAASAEAKPVRSIQSVPSVAPDSERKQSRRTPKPAKRARARQNHPSNVVPRRRNRDVRRDPPKRTPEPVG